MGKKPRTASLYDLDRALLERNDPERMRAILMTDATLLAAYEHWGVIAGPSTAALAAEIERRGLQV